MNKKEELEGDYRIKYNETYQELLELRHKYNQLRKKYDRVSNELLIYYEKYGKEGTNGRSKDRTNN